MKAKIIYTVTFLVAFLIVTGGIIYLNNNYTDIFRFNFTPVVKVDTSKSSTNNNNISMKELKNFLQKELKNDLFDSLKTLYTGIHKDTVYATSKKDASLMDSLNNLHKIIKKIDSQLAQQEAEFKAKNIAEKNNKSQKDSAYIAWTKQTARLYEAMDAKKAAKIIQSYSDNVARDILYSMRQKKAAEIMSELNPETANRITQAKSHAF